MTPDEFFAGLTSEALVYLSQREAPLMYAARAACVRRILLASSLSEAFSLAASCEETERVIGPLRCRWERDECSRESSLLDLIPPDGELSPSELGHELSLAMARIHGLLAAHPGCRITDIHVSSGTTGGYVYSGYDHSTDAHERRFAYSYFVSDFSSLSSAILAACTPEREQSEGGAA